MTTRFNWTDPDTAKNEYGDFLATLQEELGRDQCILTDGSIMRPVPPPTVTPTGVAIDTLQLHGYQHAYRKEYNEFQAKFSNGISIVNKLHVMNSPARRLFHQHTDDSGKPAAMATADWTYEARFKAGMDALHKNYAPSTTTDVASLRRTIQTLDDSKGFHPYQTEFLKLLTTLKNSGIPNAVSDTELREWVLAGIKNDIIMTSCLSVHVIDHPNATHTEIFERVSQFLNFLANKGIDPYKTSNPGFTPQATSNAYAANNHKTNRRTYRCTRCWLTEKGHNYRNCKADKCQAPGCNSGIPKDSTVCPNWTEHQDPSCKFKNTNWTGQTKRENDTTTLDQQEKKPKLAAAEIVEALMACLAAEKKP